MKILLNRNFALGLAMALLLLIWSCSHRQTAVVAPPPTVTVLGIVEGEQQTKLEQALAPFEAKTGIDVVYEGTDAFATELPDRVAAGNPPDLAMLPQPSLINKFVKAGQLIPLTSFIDANVLRASYPDTWLDLSTLDDIPYAVWYRASVKSLVWYRPTAFEAKGYDIPQSWPELMALSNRIVADGDTPWCLGMESGEATGWPGTDWIEDIMLRTAGPEAYRQWIDHQLPFNSPQVLNAFNEFGKILLTPNYISGGAASTPTQPFGEVSLGLFKHPPQCYLYRQANFISSFFPPTKTPRVDYDVFPLPGIDERFGTPLLVSGDAFVMFRDKPEARALMQYLATPQPHEIWAGLGGFISPHKQVSLDAYPDIVSQTIAQILANAEVIRFDGSDMMPEAVGTGTFWSGMVDFAKGKSAQAVAQAIDASWPK
jgi:alpha-glucoside transport system substrate-binding protein